jgi:hypothetical protein
MLLLHAQARALDNVRSEFGRFEAAVRKRHGELLDHIEQEVHKSILPTAPHSRVTSKRPFTFDMAF